MNNTDFKNLSVPAIKAMFTKGTRIKLIKMDDIQAVEPGTLGTVAHVDDIGTIHMCWDNGRGLGVALDKDEVEIIEKKEPVLYQIEMVFDCKTCPMELYKMIKSCHFNEFPVQGVTLTNTVSNLTEIPTKEMEKTITEAFITELKAKEDGPLKFIGVSCESFKVLCQR